MQPFMIRPGGGTREEHALESIGEVDEMVSAQNVRTGNDVGQP